MPVWNTVVGVTGVPGEAVWPPPPEGPCCAGTTPAVVAGPETWLDWGAGATTTTGAVGVATGTIAGAAVGATAVTAGLDD